jgi:photosystem II stability/assembly factor-like uncharacterized protein
MASSSASAVTGGHRHHRPPATVTASWQPTTTGSTAQFRGLDAVSRKVAWLGGSDGSVLRTVDGGASWQNVSPPETTGLLFRDVEAFSRDRALVLAIGPGDASRVYRTDDGGVTWTRTFTNDDPDAFYDCMAFFDHRRGLAMSDPVDGKFRIIATRDGGRTWAVQPTAGMPDAIAGEAGFAASGTCLTTAGRKDAWFGTGVGAARVFHSRDGGLTWTVAATPMHFDADTGAGIFSLAFRDRRHGLAVGGDLGAQETAVDAAALSRDGGTTWSLVPAAVAPPGYRSGSAWVAGHRHHQATAVVVGPFGSDLSTDAGRTWTPIPAPAGQVVGKGFDSVECASDGSCWASGPNGQAARLVLDRGHRHPHGTRR